MYTDLDTIRDKISKGMLLSSQVRVVNSATRQTLDILDEFPNLEEIHGTSIVLDSNYIDLLVSAFKSCPKLTKLSVILWQKSGYEFVLKRDLPNLIKTLSLRHYWLKLVVLTDAETFNINQGYTTIVLAAGHYYATTNQLTYHFGECFKVANATGLTTDGDFEYDYPEYLREVVIVAKVSNINIENLKNLVSRVDQVEVNYNPDTIGNRFVYSQIILAGRHLKRIKAIIPAVDVDEHIHQNEELVEISVYVSSVIEVDLISNLVKDYRYRYLTYNIYYVAGVNLDKLRQMGDDLVFYDLLFVLMNDRIRVL